MAGGELIAPPSPELTDRLTGDLFARPGPDPLCTFAGRASQVQEGAADDPGLAVVVAAWSGLPEALRVGIAAMVRTAKG